MKLVEMFSTVKVSVPMPDAPSYDAVLFDKARRAFELAVKDNGSPVHIEIESLDLGEIKVMANQRPDPLEIVRLILGEWLLLKPDSWQGFGVEKAVSNVMRRFGWVVLTRQAYEKLVYGNTVKDDSQVIDEMFFNMLFDWDLDHAFDAIRDTLNRFGWTMLPYEEWWSYVDEPVTATEDSREAAEIPTIQ